MAADAAMLWVTAKAAPKVATATPPDTAPDTALSQRTPRPDTTSLATAPTAPAAAPAAPAATPTDDATTATAAPAATPTAVLTTAPTTSSGLILMLMSMQMPQQWPVGSVSVHGFAAAYR